MSDLQKRILRFVGYPEQRIHEDFLRMLRAVRFKATLQYRFASGIEICIQKHAHRSKILSAERIRDELNKILQSPERTQGIDELSETGLLHYILPELDECKNVPQPYQYHQEGDVYTHILECLRSLPVKAPINIVWAVLLHDCGKPATFSSDDDRIRFNGHAEKSGEIATQVLKRLAFSNKDIGEISWLVSHHMHLGSIPHMKRVHQHRMFTHPLFPSLLKVCKADMMGSKPRDLQLYKEVIVLYKQESMLLLEGPAQLLTGKDIMEITRLKTGPKIGELLAQLHEARIEGKVTTKGEAEEFVKKAINNYPKI
jgi:poly(A) polymerase